MKHLVAILIAAALASPAFAQSSDAFFEGVALLLALIVIAVLFFLPTIIASNRGAASFGWIVLLNLLGGATGALWFAALLWACVGAKKPLPPSATPAAQQVSAATFAAQVDKTPK